MPEKPKFPSAEDARTCMSVLLELKATSPENEPVVMKAISMCRGVLDVHDLLDRRIPETVDALQSVSGRGVSFGVGLMSSTKQYIVEELNIDAPEDVIE